MNKFGILGVCMAMLCGSLSAQNMGFNGGGPQGMFPPPHGGMMPMGGPGKGPLAGGGIEQFGVNFATVVPDEKDAVVKDKKDSLYHYFVENVKFGKIAKIHFSGDEVVVEGVSADVQVTKDGAYLTLASASTEPLAIELSGKTENGALVLNVEAPLKLLFNNVVIKSKRGDAILSQGKGHVYAVLAEGSVNELYDCDNPEFAMFQGMPPGGMGMGGPKDLMAESKENPADYHVQYGITMKKPQMKKKLKIDGTFVCAGPLTISGKGKLDVHSQNKVGIKSKASLMFRPGNMITVHAFPAGKGVNAKNELYILGGALNVNCSFSQDKALTCGRNMYIKGGHTVVKAAGSEASEGMQSKFLMQIDGGVVEVAAQDDAVNSQGDLVINGGEVRAFSATNDAFDSNCNLIINGGKVFASGYGMPEGGLDCADESGYRLFINGGEVVAIGGRHSSPEKQSRQPSVQWRLDNLENGKTYGIDGVSSYKSARAYQMGGATILFSSPKLKEGKTYTLSVDGELKERIESLKSPTTSVGNMRMGFPF